MSHRSGRNPKSLEHTSEEVVPLFDDEEIPDGVSQNGSASDASTPSQEIPEPSPFLRSISTEPAISQMNRQRHISDESSGYLSFLHDDVEKLYTTGFDIGSLTSNQAVVADRDPRERRISLPHFIEKKINEDDFKIHRKVSYPHIHQPLRSLSCRSMKNIPGSNVKKKKKKKKKKVRSFPSKDAVQSPPIPEEGENENEEEEEEDEEEEFEGEEEEESENEENNPPDTGLLDPAEIQSEPSRKSSRVDVGFYIGGNEPIIPMEAEPPEILVTEPSTDTIPALPPQTSLYIPEDSALQEIAMFIPNLDSEPQLSERAALLDVPDGSESSQNRKFSTASTSSRVHFQIGCDPSSSNLKDEDSDDGGEVWKLRENGTVPNNQPSTSKDFNKDMNKDLNKDSSKDLNKASSGNLSRGSSSKRKHHHQHFKEKDLILRRQKGSEVKLDSGMRRSPTETEEAILLQKADLDEMASHRWEDVRGIRRHKIARRNKSQLHSIVHIGKAHKEKKKPKQKFDHSPHDVFVELDELFVKDEHEWEWREKARWIKFEEDVEEGADRWGKPHVASLSFHSLIELRKGLETGTVLLDLESEDFPNIVHNVVENLLIRDLIDEDVKGKILRTLLLKHKHVGDRPMFLRRNKSYNNLVGLDGVNRRHQSEKLGLLRSLSTGSFNGGLGSNSGLHRSKEEEKKFMKNEKVNLEMVKVDMDNNTTDASNIHIGLTPQDPKKNVQEIMRRIPVGSEASTVLVGTVDFLSKPVMAFVRLSEGRQLENVTEVPLPVRFVFILLGPEKGGMDYHEVGRSLSTLMTNQFFHDVAYRAESREALLQAINGFLDDTIVLPPGDWDQKTLLPIMDMARKRANLRRRKKQKQEEHQELLEKEKKYKVPLDPLQRTGCLFGGLINDIKRRYPHYISDFKDALNGTCLASFIFIFFACLSPCIAFGGLLSEKTNGLMGVSETVLSTSLCGIVMGLFSGQPLLIVGATGPVLVFEQSLYKFCESYGIEFLPFRLWIGFWVFVISSLTVAAEGSFLIRYVTRFTEEIFAILISLIFIYEVLKKLNKTFLQHPLLLHYPPPIAPYNNTGYNITDSDNMTVSNVGGYMVNNFTMLNTVTINNITEDEDPYEMYTNKVLNQPNTALMSTILCIGTFLVAWFLKICRNSKFLGRSVRRALGDFGILLAILSMGILDYLVRDEVYTQKIKIGSPFVPTLPHKRGWLINPMGPIVMGRVWVIFAAIIPAFLIFILLFMEIQLTEVILNKKDRKLKKGSGFHLDQFIMGFLTFVCGCLGLPWMCAATVRTIAHVSSLSVMSRTHAPGEKPKLVEVKEQRVTNVMVSLMIGVSLTLGVILKNIPLMVLFGVFLYLGIVSLGSVQMFKRIKLLLMPVKYHPSVGYVRRVRTFKMNLFTIIQIFSLVTLWIVKSTAAAIAFPFFLILLIPVRNKIMPKFFTHKEFEELDKEEDHDSDFDDEADPDFYEQAHMPV